MNYEEIYDDLAGNQDKLRQRLYRLVVELPSEETVRSRMIYEMGMALTTLNSFMKLKKRVETGKAKDILEWVEKKEKLLNGKK
jgi:hypothetical protein